MTSGADQKDRAKDDNGAVLTDGAGEHTHLEVEDLRVWFPVTSGILRRTTGWVHAVDGVSLTIRRGETLGLVGESGSGKTTVGRAIVRVLEPREGSIRLDGVDLLALRGSALRRQRRRFQMVFQDPYSSLDPRQTIGDMLGGAAPDPQPRRAAGRERPGSASCCAWWGSTPRSSTGTHTSSRGGSGSASESPGRWPSSPSSSSATNRSALWTSRSRPRSSIFWSELQREFGITYLFIAHDLAVVRHIAHRVAVMYLGKIVEVASADALYAQPLHPYSVALLSAVPVPDARIERSRRRIILQGDIPNPSSPPAGCRFHTRCWLRERLGNPEDCVSKEPQLASPDPGEADHVAACHFASELREMVRPGAVLPAEFAGQHLREPGS